MNGNLAMEKQYITYDEFLAQQEISERRLEYYEGEIVALASPIPLHQKIGVNLTVTIGTYLKGKTCIPFYELDCNLFDDGSVVVCPDLIVVCDSNKIGDKQIKGAPDLVIEILSDSTMRRDLLVKRHYYQKSGVREYWIVDPKRQVITVINWENNTEVGYQEFSGSKQVESKVLKNLQLLAEEVFE